MGQTMDHKKAIGLVSEAIWVKQDGVVLSLGFKV